MHSILVVDDELSIRESFSLILEGKYRMFLAASGEAALKIAADQKIDMSYLDIRMPGLDGLETLKRLRSIDPALEIIMITAVNDVSKASEAIKLGARDYVIKPFDVNQILKLTEQILRKKSILREGSQSQKKSAAVSPDLLGQSDKIREIVKILDKIGSDERVIVLGDPGTEKDLIARIIHEKSGRREGLFKSVHLSREMSSAEIKSLLFGKERGNSAFELQAKSGLLEAAAGGTLFIDNLEAAPAEILNTLISSEFTREGSQTRIPIQARLVAGAVSGGGELKIFSEFVVQVPPLRERSSDIPILANHFIEKYNAKYYKKTSVSSSALEALTNYSWPGNTAELEALLERIVLTAAEEITLDDLPLDILLAGAEGSGANFIASFEKEYIRSVFEQCGKNKERAAALLGINPLLLETKI